ncbi:MAG TPA: TetR/AcrR family transcriptional regulator [Burkholderiaceae bacterium]|nr:TetR/AcrR family transcriptional regulator [Burkholderiaceae bacterium]
MRVKTEEKRQQILAVAREVFRENGYAQTSMAEISARLGGSKGTLYSYFGSKEELFAAVMIEVARGSAEPMLDELERAGDMRSGLARFMHRAMRMLVSDEMVQYRRMLIGEAGRSRVGKLAYELGPRQYLQKFADLFAAQMREGRFRQADPWRAALHMQSLCMGAPAQLVLEGVIKRPSDEEIASAAQAAADLFLRAYALAPAAAGKARAGATRKRR